MGLIQIASAVNSQTDDIPLSKKKTGLLRRIKNSCSYDVVLESFRTFLSSVHAERGGLLFPGSENFFVLLFNTGFDLTTARRFSPEISFMNSLFSSGEQFMNISRTRLDPFFSFFSSREKESLSGLFIHEITLSPEFRCHLVLADSLLDSKRHPTDFSLATKTIPGLAKVLAENIPVLESLSRVVTVNQSRNSLKNHITSALSDKKNATQVRLIFSDLFPDPDKIQTDTDSQAVYFAIVHRIAKQTGFSNCMHVRENFDLHIVLFSAVSLDTELYFHQLMKPLEKLFGIDRISRIRPELVGTSSSATELMDFLTGEY